MCSRWPAEPASSRTPRAIAHSSNASATPTSAAAISVILRAPFARADHLYIRNYRPDRWPAGDPELFVAVGPFGDIDDGPTKQLLLNKRDDAAIKRYFDLSTAKRPAEELFDLKKDPHQLTNVASDPAYAAIRDRLKKELDGWQRETGDPRVSADDDRWDRYPYYGAPAQK